MPEVEHIHSLVYNLEFVCGGHVVLSASYFAIDYELKGHK